MNRYRKIKALLVEKGIKQIEIARELGVTHVSVTGVLNGYWKSERVQRHIAKRLGRKYEKLWGKTSE